VNTFIKIIISLIMWPFVLIGFIVTMIYYSYEVGKTYFEKMLVWSGKE
jgi:hypothetical protein